MRLRKRTLNFSYAYAGFLAFSLLAACSGQQNGASVLPSVASAPPISNGAKHAQRDAGTSGVTLTGPIVAMIKGGFTMYPGKSCGHVHVYLSSSTTMSGPAPAVNLYAQATGSGSCKTSLAASSVKTSTSPIGSPSPSPSPSPSSSSSPPPPTPTPVSSPTPVPSPSSTPAGGGSPIPTQTTISVRGPIIGTFSGGFTINAGGALHVYTGSSAQVVNGPPRTSSYAQVTGSGSLSTSITAKYVALYSSAPGNVTVTGVAKSATSYGFTANGGASYPAIPIVMNGSTIVGGAPLVTGATVKISGAGAASEAVLASTIVVSTPTPPPGSTPTATPLPISQKHVLTGDYLGPPDSRITSGWSTLAPYLTWAQVGTNIASAVAAAGIKTQIYADPNRSTAGAGDPFYTSSEATFAHDCNGNRVYDIYAGSVKQYVMNIGASSLVNLFDSFVNNHAAMGHIDALYVDDGEPLSEDYSPFDAMPCNYSDAQWIAWEQALLNSASVPSIVNGLNALSGHQTSMVMSILAASNVKGGNFEHCFSDAGQPKMTGWLWQDTETEELQTAAQHKIFECQLRNTNAASSSTDPRIYALASFLMSYDPTTSVLWEAFTTPSGFNVFPESQLVLLQPVGAAPATVSGFLQNGGTYGRQYGACFLAGHFVNSCAVVVNSDTASHPNPFPQYTHTLVLNGGGVLDGGTLSTNGPQAPSTLGPAEAAILFP